MPTLPGHPHLMYSGHSVDGLLGSSLRGDNGFRHHRGLDGISLRVPHGNQAVTMLEVPSVSIGIPHGFLATFYIRINYRAAPGWIV